MAASGAERTCRHGSLQAAIWRDVPPAYGAAMVMSATFPGVSANATGLPRSSAKAWILLVLPPREYAKFLLSLNHGRVGHSRHLLPGR
jgi:hypothetical protein